MSSHSYFDLVYEVTRHIPPGRVSTYGAIADFLSLGSARMVGWALNHCHGLKDVPAHRVVNSKGELSGRMHFKPPSSMAARLKKEGVKVKVDRVVDFERLFWHPREMAVD
ncbi:MAG TPA: MGMT family protein [Saprospiraceae bacterium]|nr:MGMT family protein [Saprospiraceae bacterium]